MKREILFRGKTYSDKWVYGCVLKGSIDNDFYILENVGATPFWINPETIGQFTGLTDKNGKKIFEGDIVKDGVHTFKVCYYDYGWFCYCVSSKGYILPLHKYFRIGQWDNCENNDFRKLEVIGNIHDNPELLGV